MLLMALVGTLFKGIANLTFHPIIVILMAFSYMTVSALISEFIRKSPLAFLLKL